MGRRAARTADLASLVGKAYESALAALPFQDFLGDMTAALGADAALISLYAPELGQGDIPIARDLPEQAQRRYREHFWAIDPWRINYQRRGLKGAATGEELMPFRAFERTEIYSDQLRRDGFFDTCCGEIFRSGNAGAAISVLRARGRPFFGRREAARLDRILPHLERAFALRRRFAALVAENTALAGIIDRLHGGAVLCDAAGRIVHASARARAILDAGTVLFVSRNRLQARDPAADTALAALLSDGADARRAPAANAAIIARARDGRAAFRLTVIRALPGTILDPAGTGLAFYVLIDAAAEPAGDRIDRIAARHALTAAETRLARALAAGDTLAGAAERLGVTINTVRSQLRQIFQKTGVARQAELMRLLFAADTRP